MTCLAVNGNVATLNFVVVGARVNTFTLTDSPTGDHIQAGIDQRALTNCSPLTSVVEDITSGGVRVVDAQPPTTYTQCRLGGWLGYGFASHAACISAVHQLARQKCIFERVATGITAFRAKYGLDANGDYAMRHCVRLYTGF